MENVAIVEALTAALIVLLVALRAAAVFVDSTVAVVGLAVLVAEVAVVF